MGTGSHRRPELRTHSHPQFAQFNDKALELVVAVRVFMANFTIAMIIVMVVVVIMMVVMHLMAQSRLPSAPTPDQANINRQRPSSQSQQPNTFAGFDFSAAFVCFAVRQQICSVDDDHIRASNLVFKQFRQRRFGPNSHPACVGHPRRRRVGKPPVRQYLPSTTTTPSTVAG
jgi:hypothetical protein